jgi:hypothetical protein
MCSQVAIVERLLRETLASVSQNILHPIRVSLKKRGEHLLVCLSLPLSCLIPSCLCFCSTCPKIV